jgi:hypothetical protein
MMSSEPLFSFASGHSSVSGEEPELQTLLHRLNNQIGIILANAELLETRLVDDAALSRARQIAASAVDAIDTVKQICVKTRP